MTNLQAAVGLGQLENIQWHLEQRQRVAALYAKYLPMLGELVSVQAVPSEAKHVYWMNSVLLSENVTMSRDEVMAKMEERNIQMRPLFYPMHIMPPILIIMWRLLWQRAYLPAASICLLMACCRKSM